MTNKVVYIFHSFRIAFLSNVLDMLICKIKRKTLKHFCKC